MSSKQQLMELIQNARWAEARETGTELCRLQGEDAEAWFLLGAIHGQMGDWEEAERCNEQAVRLAPTVSSAHFNLGVARMRQHKPGAATSLRTTLTLQPDHPLAGDLLQEACFTEGHMLAEAGKLEEAKEFLTEALRDTETAKIRTLFGEICSNLGRRWQAVEHYRRACELDPGNASYHACLADTIMLGNPSLPLREEALEHLRTAVRLDPDNIGARNNLAGTLAVLGNSEEAIAEYRTVLDRSPGQPSAIRGIVSVYEALGRFEEAHAVLRPWLELAPASPPIALAYGFLAPHIDERKAAIDALRTAIAQATCERELEIAACFRLAYLLDEEDEYDEAFHYYRRGNDLQPAVYDRDNQTRRFSALINFFNANRVPRLPRASNCSKLPIFIVGTPRSGTSLVETILASHPAVHGAGELGDIFDMRPQLAQASGTGKAFPYYLEAIDVKILDDYAKRHLAKLASLERNVARVTDKMPQNFVQLGFIDLLFPGARVIHCMRDPRDACLSIYARPFIQHHAYATDLANIAHYYRGYLQVMAHWRTVLRVPILDLRYESLVENPEKKIRELLEFCELPWDERCLRHHEAGRYVRTFSYNQVRRPIYTKSVGRWKRYEKHLEPLIEALGDACNPGSGDA